jgi:hypothetical protein
MDSIPAHSTERVQQDLSAIYQELIDHLGKGIDPAPLSAQLDSLDAQLDLIANTLQSTALSDYERYELEHRSLLMKAQRKELRDQVDVVSTGIFSPPTIRLCRAEQMDRGVLLLLSLILSGFIAAATMVLAHSLRSNT